MSKNDLRGIRIGAISSQTLGNLSKSPIDHRMKHGGRKRAYFSYCDDVMGMARTKAEAIRDMLKFIEESSKMGLVVKATAFVSRIGENKTYGERKKKRKRQRSHKRSQD